MNPVTDDINQIIYLLAEHKKGVSHLYSNYAVKFPEHAYWKNLAETKQKNQQIVQSIYFDTKEGNTDIDGQIFRSIAIKTSLDWVNRLIEEYVRHSLINALSYALDLEQAKIEQRYFDIFKTVSPKIQEIIPGLAAESQQNINLLRKELDLIRAKEPIVQPKNIGGLVSSEKTIDIENVVKKNKRYFGHVA